MAQALVDSDPVAEPELHPRIRRPRRPCEGGRRQGAGSGARPSSRQRHIRTHRHFGHRRQVTRWIGTGATSGCTHCTIPPAGSTCTSEITHCMAPAAAPRRPDLDLLTTEGFEMTGLHHRQHQRPDRRRRIPVRGRSPAARGHPGPRRRARRPRELGADAGDHFLKNPTLEVVDKAGPWSVPAPPAFGPFDYHTHAPPIPTRGSGRTRKAVPGAGFEFLVSIPTPFNAVNSFVEFDSQVEVAYAYEQRLRRQRRGVQEAIPPRTWPSNGICRPSWRQSRAGSPTPTAG